MKNNIKIAKQLLKIARSMISKKEITAGSPMDRNYDIQKQLEILRTFPKNPVGDAAIHQYVKNAFLSLYTIKNGTFDGFEAWKAYLIEKANVLIAKANQNIAATGNLGLTPKEKNTLTSLLGWQANQKFLVSITPGKFKHNILQSGPGDSYENEFDIPFAPTPGIDKNTQELALNGPPTKLPNNSSWLITIPQGIINVQNGLKEMVVSFSNRIIGGTQIGSIDVGYPGEKPKNQKQISELKSSWTEISDTDINGIEMRILAKLATQPNHVLELLKKSFMNLATQLGIQASSQSIEEFNKKQNDVVIAFEGMNKKIVGSVTTYRDGVSHVLDEYNSMVDIVKEQGGNVDAKGNITLPKKEENVTASAKNRTAGILDTLKKIGNKIVSGISSFFGSIFKRKEEIKNDAKTITSELIDWSEEGASITASFEKSNEAIRECLAELNAIAGN